eukprot:751428-Hanusia_phi.AAC.1
MTSLSCISSTLSPRHRNDIKGPHACLPDERDADSLEALQLCGDDPEVLLSDTLLKFLDVSLQRFLALLCLRAVEASGSTSRQVGQGAFLQGLLKIGSNLKRLGRFLKTSFQPVSTQPISPCHKRLALYLSVSCEDRSRSPVSFSMT